MAKSLVSSSYCTIRHRGLLWRRIYPESTFLEVKVTNNNKEATVSMKNKRFTSNLFKSCGRKIRRKSSSALLHKQFFSNYELSRLQNRFRVVKWREFCKYRIFDVLAFKNRLFTDFSISATCHWYVIDIIFLLMVNDIVKILDIHPEVVKDFPQECQMSWSSK